MVSINELPGIVQVFGLTVVFAVLMVAIVSGVANGFAAGTSEANISATGVLALGNLVNQLPLIGTIAGLLVLFGFAIQSFARPPSQ